LEELFEEKPSAYAAEGTEAHSVAEQKLRNWIEGHPRRKVKAANGEMDEATNVYKDYVLEVYNKEKKKSDIADLFIEVQVDLTPWIPEGFGTSDAVIVSNHTLHVIDLKFGKGVKVNAPHNPQLTIYAAGVMALYDCLYDFEKVKLHIVQPRRDHISTWELTTQELADWMENVVKPAAIEAWNGEGERQAGDWCKFCRAKGNCNARAARMKAIDERYQRMCGMLLTDQQIAELLPELPGLIDWAKEVQEFALDQALKGTKYEGYKVVEGTSKRKITDESKASEALQNAGFEYNQIMTKPKLQTITALEKLVGKKDFAEIVGEYIEKPQGKPTLVPVSDKRPEFGSVANDFKDGID
jgi:hypothetical protein